MRDYILLIKNQLRMGFRKRTKSDKNQNSMLVMYIVLGVLYMLLMGSIGAGIYSIGAIAKATGSVSHLLVLFYLVSMIAVVIFGTVAMMTNIYFNKDIEFLSSIPVKSGTVFMAKLTVVYIYEMITTAAIIFPPVIILGISVGGGLNYYIAAILSIIIVPAIPMLLASLLATPFMYIASFFKQRSAFATVAIILVFAAIMFAYYGLIGAIQVQGDGGLDFEAIFMGLKSAVNRFEYVLLPLLALGKFATGESVYGLTPIISILINLLIALGFVAVLGIISYFIASFVYSRGAAAQLENRKTTTKKQDFAASSIKKSLMQKDIKQLLRTPAFGFQCLSFVILCPVMVFAMKFMYSGFNITVDGEEAAEAESIINITMMITSIMLIMLMGGGINTVAASAISREGKQFVILKTLPVDPKEIINAKLQLSFILAAIPIVLSAIITIFTASIGLIDFFFLTVYAIIFAFGTACMNFNNDIRRPKLDWTAPTEAVKNRKEMVVTMLICMLLSFVAVIPPIIAVVLDTFGMPPVTTMLIKIAVWLFACGLSFLYAFLARLNLYNNIYYKWDCIGI